MLCQAVAKVKKDLEDLYIFKITGSQIRYLPMDYQKINDETNTDYFEY